MLTSAHSEIERVQARSADEGGDASCRRSKVPQALQLLLYDAVHVEQSDVARARLLESLFRLLQTAWMSISLDDIVDVALRARLPTWVDCRDVDVDHAKSTDISIAG